MKRRRTNYSFAATRQFFWEYSAAAAAREFRGRRNYDRMAPLLDTRMYILVRLNLNEMLSTRGLHFWSRLTLVHAFVWVGVEKTLNCYLISQIAPYVVQLQSYKFALTAFKHQKQECSWNEHSLALNFVCEHFGRLGLSSYSEYTLYRRSEVLISLRQNFKLWD